MRSRIRLRPELCLTLVLGGCDREPPPQRASEALAPAVTEQASELYFPKKDAGIEFKEPVAAQARCPAEMVHVAGRVCVDRYEARLVSSSSGDLLSPHYPPTPLAARLHAEWSERAPQSRGRLGYLKIPELPPFQLALTQARAESRPLTLPSGYLTRNSAELACHNAGKRLCSEDEWVTACRGEHNLEYPYGDSFRDLACNVHRKSHPAGLIHGDSSRNHLDPRLGLASDEDGPLLRPTGASPECRSEWAGDAIYDMVGNLDEWVAPPGSQFLGGFFSRGTRSGCSAKIASHSPDYLDYSLGVRCCLDAKH